MAGRLRLVGRVAAMAGWLLLCLPLYYLSKSIAAHNPWPRRFLGGICRIAGVKVHVIGELPRPGTFLLPNHVSWIDIPALAGATGTAFVAHDGLAGVPLLHWLCAMNDTVFVARHDRTSIRRQIEQVRQAIRDTGVLTIFAEGTTGDGRSLLPFKSSLLSALDPAPEGVAVQPVLLDYGPDVAEIAWVEQEPGLANFERIVSRSKPVQLTIHFLAPLAGDALVDRKAIAAGARDAILAAMRPVG